MKPLLKTIAIALIIIALILTVSASGSHVIRLKASSGIVHLVNDDGVEVGSFTLGDETTITFKRAK